MHLCTQNLIIFVRFSFSIFTKRKEKERSKRKENKSIFIFILYFHTYRVFSYCIYSIQKRIINRARACYYYIGNFAFFVENLTFFHKNGHF